MILHGPNPHVHQPQAPPNQHKGGHEYFSPPASDRDYYRQYPKGIVKVRAKDFVQHQLFAQLHWLRSLIPRAKMRLQVKT